MIQDPDIKVTIMPSARGEQATIESIQKPISAHKKNKHHDNHLAIAILGVCGIINWIIFFSLGMLIDSSQYRTSLNADFTWYKFIMTMITFTPSNIAILCLISAFIGGCASLLVITKAKKTLDLDQSATKSNSFIYMSENPFSSMMRGILVFFAFLAGVFVTGSTAITQPTEQVYTQAAGIVSMIAFLVGYDPGMFRTLLNVSEKLK